MVSRHIGIIAFRKRNRRFKVLYDIVPICYNPPSKHKYEKLCDTIIYIYIYNNIVFVLTLLGLIGRECIKYHFSLELK